MAATERGEAAIHGAGARQGRASWKQRWTLLCMLLSTKCDSTDMICTQIKIDDRLVVHSQERKY